MCKPTTHRLLGRLSRGQNVDACEIRVGVRRGRIVGWRIKPLNTTTGVGRISACSKKCSHMFIRKDYRQRKIYSSRQVVAIGPRFVWFIYASNWRWCQTTHENTRKIPGRHFYNANTQHMELLFLYERRQDCEITKRFCETELTVAWIRTKLCNLRRHFNEVSFSDYFFIYIRRAMSKYLY